MAKKRVVERREIKRIIRLTPTEKAEITSRMSGIGEPSFSQYVRDSALKRQVKKGRNYADFVSQLRMFGNNFNQATAALNYIKKSGTPELFDFTLIEKHLQDCAEMVRKIEEKAK